MNTLQSINLASEPFRRDRPMLVASIALAIVLAAVLGMQLFLATVASGEGSEARRSIEQTRSELADLAQRESQVRSVLARPENEAALERSLFLNTLLLRKGVSWTLIFRDLQEVMPYNVRLVQVRPQVLMADPGSTASNQIQLEMVVVSRDVDPLLNFVRKLEASKLFGEVWVSAEYPPSDNDPFYRYQMSVRYVREL